LGCAFFSVISCWSAEREELVFGGDPGGSLGGVWDVFFGLASGVGESVTGGRTGGFPKSRVTSKWSDLTWNVATHMESNWDSAALEHNPPH